MLSHVSPQCSDGIELAILYLITALTQSINSIIRYNNESFGYDNIMDKPSFILAGNQIFWFTSRTVHKNLLVYIVRALILAFTFPPSPMYKISVRVVLMQQTRYLCSPV